MNTETGPGMPPEDLVEYLPGRIWLKDYPIHFAGCDFSSRMTVVRLSDGKVLLHSPCDMDERTKTAIDAIGQVAYIVAPGSYHHLHVRSCQQAYPDADTYICPGVERKCPELEFDWILGDQAPHAWAEELEQVLVRGNRFIWEVAFFHRETKTLILVDLIENIGDKTPGIDWTLKFYWKAITFMWNKAKPAPEYQMGWKDKAAARRCLEKILEWNFERIVISHGDLIETRAKEIAREAWKTPLSFQ